jgi:hypothetical protein
MPNIIAAAVLLVAGSCRTPGPASDTASFMTPEIAAQFDAAIADEELDLKEVESLSKALGGHPRAQDGLAFYNAIRNSRSYTISSQAIALAETLSLNRGLSKAEQSQLVAGKTFAESQIPPEVIKVMREARLAGAITFDVRERNPDDPEDGEWSAMPQRLAAQNSLTFNYTEITPEVLHKDFMDQTDDDKVSGITEGVVTYLRDSCKEGKGSIAHQYDEALHPNIFARGRSCQKWSDNCVILIDGTLHCLPASRRITAQGPAANLILANTALARGKKLLFSGKITAHGGVITQISLSGRLGKKISDNNFAFIDGRALLKAWGFELSAGLIATVEDAKEEDILIHEETMTLRGRPAKG